MQKDELRYYFGSFWSNTNPTWCQGTLTFRFV